MFQWCARTAAAVCLLGFGAVENAGAQTVVESQFIRAYGPYSDAANWLPAEVPNNTDTRQYNVTLPVEGGPSIDMSASVSNLTQLGGKSAHLGVSNQTLTVIGRTEMSAPRISISGYTAAGGLFDAGDFSPFSSGVLTGAYDLYSAGTAPATLRFRGANIQALRNATLQLWGRRSSVEDENGRDALANLGEVDAGSTLMLNERDLVTSAPLLVQGTLQLGQYHGSVLTAAGGLKNFDPATRTLSGGQFLIGPLFSEPETVPGELRFAGGDIVNNGSAIQIAGPGSRIADLSGLDALRNLTRNLPEGSIHLWKHNMVLPHDFTNDGRLTSEGSNFTVVGRLTNFDAASRTLLSGSYLLAGYAYPSDQSTSDTPPAKMQFSGADIVHNGAELIMSQQAAITDELGRDALRNFTHNLSTGRFAVGAGQRFVAAGDFTNAGALEIWSWWASGIPEDPTIPAGEFAVSPGSAYRQTGGSVRNRGILTADRIAIESGSLSGNGTINGNVTIGEGLITPGGVINGDLTLSGSSRLQAVISGHRSATPAARVSGKLALAGKIEIEVQSEYFLASNAVFTLLESRQPLTGTFDNAADGARVTASNGSGSFVVRYESNAVKLTGFEANPLPAQLLNIATRGYLKAGNDVFGNRYLIGGFIITGAEPKTVVVRGLGPSLSRFNVPTALPNPVLSVRRSDQSEVTSNDDWKNAQQREIERTGLAPSDEREAAMLVTLDPGHYTVVLEEKTGIGGNALVEVYDLSASGSSKLANVSTRGFVTPDDPLIGGVIVGGEGQANAELIVRAIGRSQAGGGDYTAMADPRLELRDREGTLLAYNDDVADNWEQFTGSARELRPANPKHAAVRVSVPRGEYTAIVRGDGSGLVEFYDLRR